MYRTSARIPAHIVRRLATNCQPARTPALFYRTYSKGNELYNQVRNTERQMLSVYERNPELIEKIHGLQGIIQQEVIKVDRHYFICQFPVRIPRENAKYSEEDKSRLKALREIQDKTGRLIRRLTGVRPPIFTGIPTISDENALEEIASLTKEVNKFIEENMANEDGSQNHLQKP